MDKVDKRIDISSSSLVALKAELLTKQSQVKQQKLLVPTSVIKRPMLAKAIVKQNSGVLARAEKDEEQTEQENKSYEKSKSILEEKAKLYEKLTREGLNSDEEGDDSRFLVNFQRKQVEDVLEKARSRNETEENRVEIPPSNPDEEWVDYVDCLGRSRRCLRKDLPDLIRQEKDLIRDGSEASIVHPDLLSDDMRRELQRQQWEKEEEESKRKGKMHYQDVLFEEARSHGVGYFAFSKDDLERAEQQDRLKELRQQTEDIRKRKAEQDKKRKAELKERLNKVRDRKRLKMGLPILEKEDVEQEQVEELEESLDDEHLLTERQEPKLDPTQVRPWDMGKDGVPKTAVMSQRSWVKKQREERLSEFAPPSLYAQGSKQKSGSSQASEPFASLHEIPLPSSDTSGTNKLSEDSISQNLAFLRQQTEKKPQMEETKESSTFTSSEPSPQAHFRRKPAPRPSFSLDLGFDVSAVKSEEAYDGGSRREPRKGVEIAPPASMDYYANTHAKKRGPVKKFNLADSVDMGRKQQEQKSNNSGDNCKASSCKGFLGMDMMDMPDTDSD